MKKAATFVKDWFRPKDIKHVCWNICGDVGLSPRKWEAKQAK